ncbi:hypothetical protein LP7551_02398 [Roseibium album]|nr:hypothetical protein LP7551_02398 [Roseibium album]
MKLAKITEVKDRMTLSYFVTFIVIVIGYLMMLAIVFNVLKIFVKKLKDTWIDKIISFLPATLLRSVRIRVNAYTLILASFFIYASVILLNSFLIFKVWG